MLMGVPSVFPSNVPERICTVSVSLRGETIFDWPGRRRSRSGWRSASVSARRGGQPSTTTPTPPPWLSPQVVTRKRCPNVFAMAVSLGASRTPGQIAGGLLLLLFLLLFLLLLLLLLLFLFLFLLLLAHRDGLRARAGVRVRPAIRI